MQGASLLSPTSSQILPSLPGGSQDRSNSAQGLANSRLSSTPSSLLIIETSHSGITTEANAELRTSATALSSVILPTIPIALKEQVVQIKPRLIQDLQTCLVHKCPLSPQASGLTPGQLANRQGPS